MLDKANEHCKHGKTGLVYCADCHVERLTEEVRQLREEREKYIFLAADAVNVAEILHERLKKTTQALEWYANEDIWFYGGSRDKTEADYDAGDRARTVLSEIKGTTQDG